MFFKSNAILTINVKSATPTGRDPASGRPILGVTSTSALPCFLEQKNPSTDYKLPGIDNPICYLEGITEGEPLTPLAPNQFYPITITLQSGTKTARFYLLPTPTGGLVPDNFFGGFFLSGWLVD